MERITNIQQINELTAEGGSVFIQYTAKGNTATIFTKNAMFQFELSDALYAKLNKLQALFNPGIMQVDLTKLPKL